MSDVNLIMFGCVVTFIGVAGAYVYIRESYLAGEEPVRAPEVRQAEPVSVRVA